MARAISQGRATPLPLPKPKTPKSKLKPPKTKVKTKGSKVKSKGSQGKPKPGTRPKAPKARRQARAAKKQDRKDLKRIDRQAQRHVKQQQDVRKIKRATRRPWYWRWATKTFGIHRDDSYRVDVGSPRQVRAIRDNLTEALYKADQRRTKIEARAKARGRRTPRETKELTRIQQFIQGNVNIATAAKDRAQVLEQYEPLSGYEQQIYAKSLKPGHVKTMDVANLQLLETAQTIRYDKPTGTPGQVKSVGREFGGGIQKTMRYPARTKQTGKHKGEPIEIELQSVRLAPWLPGKAWDDPYDDVSVHTHPARMWLREKQVQKAGFSYGYPTLGARQGMTAKGRAKLENINRELASIHLDDVPSGADLKNMDTIRPKLVITPRRNILLWRIKEAPIVNRLDALDKVELDAITRVADLEAFNQVSGKTPQPKSLRQARKIVGKYQKLREQLIANRLAREGVVIKFGKKGEKLQFPMPPPPTAAPVTPAPPPAPPSPPAPLDPSDWDPF